jgi:hypothetical protein
MCTLTFVPGLPRGGYLLGHNRDERLTRGPGLPPSIVQLDSAPGAPPTRAGATVLAPRDSDAGGTWIGVDSHGHCLAILNGDGPPAAPAPEDARSRGLLVLDLLRDARADVVRRTLERAAAAGTLRSRPFKLVAAEPDDAEARMLLLEWDGARLTAEERRGAQCIVSSGFQPQAVAAARGAAFAALVRGLPAPRDAGAVETALRHFHASHAPGAPDGDAFSVCTHRDDVRTVSRTLVSVSADEVRMDYVAGSPCQGATPLLTRMPRR